MLVNGKPYRTIFEQDDKVIIIDQNRLPFEFVLEELTSFESALTAISTMKVRGAPLIGATAAYALALAANEIKPGADFDKEIAAKAKILIESRPTAVNLAWAVNCVIDQISNETNSQHKPSAAWQAARNIAEEDVANCQKIGQHGAHLLSEIKPRNGKTLNILTHCNAGWLATIDFGTATAPIYEAQRLGIDLHVWVDETRPRNQGSRLTAWELYHQRIKHTIIADNTGGHLMQSGMVDIVLVGSDRTTAGGDVCNKIGTYLKAIAAMDNDIPFYAALPVSTIDFSLTKGVGQIPIELRSPDELRYTDVFIDGSLRKGLCVNPQSEAANYAFDVTPARLVTGLITERGICRASETAIAELYPEKVKR